MSYFGYPTDLIEHLASECEATAVVHEPETKRAMIYLANRLYELAPLYEAICAYGMDQDSDNIRVVQALNDVINQRNKDE